MVGGCLGGVVDSFSWGKVWLICACGYRYESKDKWSSSSHRCPLNRAICCISSLMGLNWKTTFFIKLRLTKMLNSPVYAAEFLHILRYLLYSAHSFIIA